MKDLITLNDVLYNDLVNDDTVVTLLDLENKHISLTGYRWEDDIADWSNWTVHEVKYIPLSNTLVVTLCLILSYEVTEEADK